MLGDSHYNQQQFIAQNTGRYHPSEPTLLEHAGTTNPLPVSDYAHHVVLHWKQAESERHPSGEEDDEQEGYRPFTPPPPRERLSYTRYQLELLNVIYGECRYPNSTQKQLIAKRVGITRDQVKIWFQNRRRKDVLAKQGKPKDGKDSSRMASVESSSSTDDAVRLDEDGPPSTDNLAIQLVPELVMKSIVTELLRFKNQECSKTKAKKKSKHKRKALLLKKQTLNKNSLNSTYNASLPRAERPSMFRGFDMVNPPNQITPSAFLNKSLNGFKHAKETSAFRKPQDSLKQGGRMSPLSFLLESAAINGFLSSSQSISSLLHDKEATTNSDISLDSLPVLSDLLSHQKRPANQTLQPWLASQMSGYSEDHRSGNYTGQSNPHAHIPSPNHNTPAQLMYSPSRRPEYTMKRVHPYSLTAEPPVVLSSINTSEIHHSRAPYISPNPCNNHNTQCNYRDPFQPYLITSVNNPYYEQSPCSMTWQNTPACDSFAYTEL